jgi:UDP-glucose 4-epimerase
MTVLVTAGTGFIGRCVVERLRDDGERVVSYDRAVAAGLPAGVTAVRGELSDVARLAATIEGQRVRGIVHAAGTAGAALSLAMPATTVSANALGTFQLLEAGRLAGFAGRVVLLSSVAVYADDPTPFAVSKAFGDLLGQVYTRRYGMDVVSLRFGEAYGPGRLLPGVLEEIIDAALAGRALRLATDAAGPHRLVHVEDVARAILAALRAPAPAARVYDIAGEPVRLDQVLAIVRDRVPRAAIELDGAPDAEIAPVPATAADRELGYRPRWSLARGLDDLWTWREAQAAC